MFSRRTTTVVTLAVVALVAIGLVASALPGAASPARAETLSAVRGAPALLPAHAQLLSTTPADGASIPSATGVVLRFSEDVNSRFLVLRVTGPAGNAAAGAPTVAKGTVTQPLVDTLPAGRYTVAYRVVSVDGHPISGTFAYTTTTSVPTEGAGTPAATPTTLTPSTTAPATTAPATPTPSGATTTATAPTSAATGTSPWVWVAIGVVVLLALLGAATAWRTIGGPGADAEADAAEDADAGTRH